MMTKHYDNYHDFHDCPIVSMQYQARGLLIFMWSLIIVLYIAGVCDDGDKLDDVMILMIVIKLTMNVCVFVGIDE